MSLAYPGPTKKGIPTNAVGRDAFLEALRDPGLRARILDKAPQVWKRPCK